MTMTEEQQFDPEQWLEVASAALAIDIPEACRPGVVENLAIASAMAEIISQVPLPAGELELANHFVPQDA